MLSLQVPFRYAEEAKNFLRQHDLFAHGHEIAKDQAHVYFPVSKRFKEPSFPHAFVEKRLPSREDPLTWGETLVRKGILTRRELEQHFISSFDLVGDTAILEIMPELESKERKIAEVLMQLHPNIKTVAKKAGATRGEYRVRKIKVIAGRKTLRLRYKENGCVFEVNPNAVFFSPRLAFERQRIAELVKPSERVLAVFAGAGFFPIVIAKKQPRVQKIVAVELNPKAIPFLKKNVALNHVEKKVEILEGDALNVMARPHFRKWADRVVMPLPHTAHAFLSQAARATRKGGVIHFYHIPAVEGTDAFGDARRLAKSAFEKEGRKFRLLSSRVVKSYAPHVDEVVLDLKVL